MTCAKALGGCGTVAGVKSSQLETCMVIIIVSSSSSTS